MKVKVIDEYTHPESSFEDVINDFIKDKKVIDIKYVAVFGSPSTFLTMHYTYLIMYEE